MPDTLDQASRIARAIRSALARGITQRDGSFVQIDDEAIGKLAGQIAAALAEPPGRPSLRETVFARLEEFGDPGPEIDAKHLADWLVDEGGDDDAMSDFAADDLEAYCRDWLAARRARPY
ncbi:MAG TPA: hypothetical protein VJ770_11915 [Stellaceae bacterium]|nr:hypothetical protein [Stellaceae bacterium]